MATIHVAESAVIEARTEDVYAVVADYRIGHPSILPPEYFSDFMVEEGGYGAGTVVRFTMRIAGREREFRQRVSEPDPGRVIVEQNVTSQVATSFTFTPVRDDQHVRVEIATVLASSGGIAGVMERILLPRLLRDIYRKELGLLAAVATHHTEAAQP